MVSLLEHSCLVAVWRFVRSLSKTAFVEIKDGNEAKENKLHYTTLQSVLFSHLPSLIFVTYCLFKALATMLSF